MIHLKLQEPAFKMWKNYVAFVVVVVVETMRCTANAINVHQFANKLMGLTSTSFFI